MKLSKELFEIINDRCCNDMASIVAMGSEGLRNPHRSAERLKDMKRIAMGLAEWVRKLECYVEDAHTEETTEIQ